MAIGRPRIYDAETAESVLERLADGESLSAICRSEEMPSRPTIHGWVLDDIENFASKYARAREIQAHVLADEIISIADTIERGTKTTTKADGSTETVEGDMIEHRRLRYDARKWAVSKIMPKVYGDRLQNQQLDKDGNPTDPVVPVLNVTVSRE
jgi:terminase small subunit-like protein